MSRHRQSTTPMDFEWENGAGRIDSNSPFITSVQQQSAKKRKLTSSASEARADGLTRDHQLNAFGATGTHSVFDTPSRNSQTNINQNQNPFATPNRPQLREPNGQHFLFSTGKNVRVLPSLPGHMGGGAWEPRTPQSVVDFSSGGETPGTPAVDSDMGTPDTQLVNRMGGLGWNNGDTVREKPPRKSKRESFMGLFGRVSPSKDREGRMSPTKERDIVEKDEREKESGRKGYSKKAEHRVMKRRSKKNKYATAEDYDSDTEPGGGKKSIMAPFDPSKPRATGMLSAIPGALTWVEAHPNLPMVLSYYLQFVINSVLGFVFLYLIYSLVTAIFNDVSIEAINKEREIMHDIAVCVDHYRKNGCDGPNRVPVLEEPCRAWEFCMRRDARKVARASVGAKAGAKILNSFAEEFSWKSLLFTAIVLFGGFNLSNWAFNRIRKDSNQYPPTHPNHPHNQPAFDHYPPQTPQRQISGGSYNMDMNMNNAWNTTPYDARMAMGYSAQSQQRPGLIHASQSLPALPSSDTAEDGGVGGDGKDREREKNAAVNRRGGWISRR